MSHQPALLKLFQKAVLKDTYRGHSLNWGPKSEIPAPTIPGTAASLLSLK